MMSENRFWVMYSVTFESLFDVGVPEVEQVAANVCLARADDVLANVLNDYLAVERRAVLTDVVSDGVSVAHAIQEANGYLDALMLDGWEWIYAMTEPITFLRCQSWRTTLKRPDVPVSWHVGQGRRKLFCLAESEATILELWS